MCVHFSPTVHKKALIKRHATSVCVCVCVCVCCVKSKGGIERAVLQEGTHCRLKRRATSQIMLTAFLSLLRPLVQPPDNIHGSNKQQRANKHEVNAVERPLNAYIQRNFACAAYIYRHASIQTYIHALNLLQSTFVATQNQPRAGHTLVGTK